MPTPPSTSTLGVGEGSERIFPGYVVPDSPDTEFRAAIEKLPAQESPEIFGLHPNADLTFCTLAVGELVQSTVISTMPKSGGGGRRHTTPEETVDKICEDLLSKVPVAFVGEVTKEMLRKPPVDPRSPSPCTFDRRLIA